MSPYPHSLGVRPHLSMDSAKNGGHFAQSCHILSFNLVCRTLDLDRGCTEDRWLIYMIVVKINSHVCICRRERFDLFKEKLLQPQKSNLFEGHVSPFLRLSPPPPQSILLPFQFSSISAPFFRYSLPERNSLASIGAICSSPRASEQHSATRLLFNSHSLT